MREPERYTGERSGYRKWRETLHAYLTAHDQSYVKVLLWVEDLGWRPFKPSDLLDLSDDLDFDAADMVECKEIIAALKVETNSAKLALLLKVIDKHVEDIRQ